MLLPPFLERFVFDQVKGVSFLTRHFSLTLSTTVFCLLTQNQLSEAASSFLKSNSLLVTIDKSNQLSWHQSLTKCSVGKVKNTNNLLMGLISIYLIKIEVIALHP